MPSPALNVFWGQGVHVYPVVLQEPLYNPGPQMPAVPQLVQVVDPGLDEKNPVEQEKHLLDPISLVCPAGHKEHTD